MAGEEFFGIAAALVGIAASVVGAMGWLWVTAKRSGIHERDIKDIKGTVGSSAGRLDGIERRLTVIETRFEPFMRVLNESVERMFPKNPIDEDLGRRLKNGSATIEDFREADRLLLEDIETCSRPHQVASNVLLRAWVAMRIAEIEIKSIIDGEGK